MASQKIPSNFKVKKTRRTKAKAAAQTGGSPRMAQVKALLVEGGEIVGGSALASLAKGYRQAKGQSMEIAGKGFLEYRLLAGVGLIGASLWKKTGKVGPHLFRLGVGSLVSYTSEMAEHQGSKMGAGAGAAPAAKGVVIGNVSPGAGFIPSHRLENIQHRLDALNRAHGGFATGREASHLRALRERLEPVGYRGASLGQQAAAARAGF